MARCEMLAHKGTGTGICDRPLDSYGQCDRASSHVELEVFSRSVVLKLSTVQCSQCGKAIASANGIFVHAGTGRSESFDTGFHHARP